MKIDPGIVEGVSGGSVYMGTVRNVGDWGVGVECHLHLRPVYLVRRGDFVQLVSFASSTLAQEWLDDFGIDEVLWKWEPEDTTLSGL